MAEPIYRPMIYLINLDRSPERLKASMDQLAAVGLPWQRISAVDGRTLGPGPWPDVDTPAYRRNMGRGFSANEVGCTFSHIKTLKAFLASDQELAVVLEDDFLFSDPANFGEVLQALVANRDRWDVVKLAGNRNCLPVRQVALTDGVALGAPLMKYVTSSAYSINRRAAEEVLAHIAPIHAGYDHQLDNPWIYDRIKYRVVDPAIVVQNTKLQSAIGYPDSRKFPAYQRIPTLLYRMGVALRRLAYNAAHGFFLFGR